MKKVLFLRRIPYSRIYKEAKVLKGSGKYELILAGREIDGSLFYDVFDSLIRLKLSRFLYYRSFIFFVVKHSKRLIIRGITYMEIKKVIDLAKFLSEKQAEEQVILDLVQRIKPDIIHVVVQPNTWAQIILKNTHIPLVYDGYDLLGLSRGLENLGERQRKIEKYCLEKSSAVLHKGPGKEIEFFRKKGYKISQPVMQWLDYCDESLFVKPEKLRLNDDFHLVHIGSLSDEERIIHVYYLPLIKILSAQKIHFHVYPNPEIRYKKNNLSKYRRISVNNKYFHLHDSVSYKDLSSKIRKYDYGMWISWRNGPHPVMDRRSKISMGNKLFSYLESSLPVIVNPELAYGAKIVSKYNIGHVVPLKSLVNLRQKLEKSDYKRIQENVIRSREILSLKNKGKELCGFYDKIINQ